MPSCEARKRIQYLGEEEVRRKSVGRYPSWTWENKRRQFNGLNVISYLFIASTMILPITSKHVNVNGLTAPEYAVDKLSSLEWQNSPQIFAQEPFLDDRHNGKDDVLDEADLSKAATLASSQSHPNYDDEMYPSVGNNPNEADDVYFTPSHDESPGSPPYFWSAVLPTLFEYQRARRGPSMYLRAGKRAGNMYLRAGRGSDMFLRTGKRAAKRLIGFQAHPNYHQINDYLEEENLHNQVEAGKRGGTNMLLRAGRGVGNTMYLRSGKRAGGDMYLRAGKRSDNKVFLPHLCLNGGCDDISTVAEDIMLTKTKKIGNDMLLRAGKRKGNMYLRTGKRSLANIGTSKKAGNMYLRTGKRADDNNYERNPTLYQREGNRMYLRSGKIAGNLYWMAGKRSGAGVY